MLLSTSLAAAKGESAGIVRLAAPIPRDAEPGSTLTVEFTATITDPQGQPVPIEGSPIVLKLIGLDGTTTEALAAERSTPGSYTATITVPASGITSAIFGLRGSAVMPDGTSSLQDLPFDVDGLLFTTTAHPAAPAANAPTAATAAPAPDLRPSIAVGLVAVAIAALAIALILGRRRSFRSA
jgi:hypothetical protein